MSNFSVKYVCNKPLALDGVVDMDVYCKSMQMLRVEAFHTVVSSVYFFSPFLFCFKLRHLLHVSRLEMI